MEDKYTATIYVAAPGTPLLAGGTSAAGHVYFKVAHGKDETSFGFAPIEHGVTTGPGMVYNNDAEQYEAGLERVDHVVLGNAPGDGSAQRLFVVQGDPGDPAHVRASMTVEEAARTPVEQSFAKVEQLSQAQHERTLAAQQQEPVLEQARAPLQMG
ncbi:TPA: hypothetical protein QDZ34_001474 [Stenotrophomonas maltophilia]|nr:hypothetical protein [Stenotrophomonas maltophilia]HDS1025267.1 hypothetical protein [Stenotrophomonas maltophilia]HDS1029520.1 hypothetical protein [Stenotrophomonas maltophilia]HDS1034138.1 hypothetical protein [Stenotrophomonas maltophilia]